MRVVLAPDSFKECLPAAEVAAALARGWRRVDAQADLRLLPMADGGEGTTDALVSATHGQCIECTVHDPLGRPVQAAYGLLGDRETAVVEVAAASGLHRVPRELRDPARATSYGTGELIRAALDRGARRLIVGLGGSATNDGGAGIAQALGFRLLDDKGDELPRGGAALARLARIDASGAHPQLYACEITAACDVENPLCGPDGATAIYGPQKGVTPELLPLLDSALAHYATILARDLGADVAPVPGAGAAGGIGAGLMAFARAALRPGVALVAEACGLEEHICGADLVITGEGKLDAQSLSGKTPIGVARIAAKHGVRVVAVAGLVQLDADATERAGFQRVLSLTDEQTTQCRAMQHAAALLDQAGAQLARELGGRTGV
jgi:glycerate kinase